MRSRLTSAGYLNATFWYEKKLLVGAKRLLFNWKAPYFCIYETITSSLALTPLQASCPKWSCFYCFYSAWHLVGTWTPQWFASTHSTYWQDHAVLEIWKFTVTLLTAVQSILLINHFLIAVLSWAGLIHRVLFAKIHHCCHRAKIVCLREKTVIWDTEHQAYV